MRTFRTIMVLAFLTGLLAACDYNEHRFYSNKSDCANAAPSYNQDCDQEYEN